ncbi:protein FAR1-RELATED SEQUENCE 6-like [Silene latifolia]|uniref:protein FAR1-RELATED SEQUENCE 6-like n=1 Tax=Silene latifolia TaxID=37657 RepID=UPI003D7744A0
MQVMDSQSYSNINETLDKVNDEATHWEGQDGEINFETIDLLDDEEAIPEDYLASLEENMSDDGEENSPSNTEDEFDGDNNDHSVIENVEAPQDGMKFETVEELKKHLRNYAKQCGFSIRQRNVKPSPKTKLPPKHILWVCNKAGKQVNRSQNKIKPRPSQMIGCNAKFNAKEFEGRWRYTKVELGHNHDLNPEDKKRQEKLVGPDSIAMYHYFMKSMKESDNFFFMLDLERDGRLRNVMWVDARSRAAYKDFCDAVGLDTTYLNNKYEMPFAPFIGINHHGQTILLGCVLLSREDTESFRWLLRTWVDCMGVAPRAIITDQSIPITKAVELEMPNTRHRWCLWHIMEKQHKKLKNYKDFEKIKAAMANCVYDSMSVGEFEVGWKNFVDEFGLAKNAWLYCWGWCP